MNLSQQVTQLCEDSLKPNGKVLYVAHGRKVFNTVHGMDRLKERQTMNYKAMRILFRRAIEKLQSIKVRAEQELLFFSKSLNQGFVAAVDALGNLRLITFLPPGRHNAMPGTELELMESYQTIKLK
jgi:hypothetical protein